MGVRRGLPVGFTLSVTLCHRTQVLAVCVCWFAVWMCICIRGVVADCLISAGCTKRSPIRTVSSRSACGVSGLIGVTMMAIF